MGNNSGKVKKLLEYAGKNWRALFKLNEDDAKRMIGLEVGLADAWSYGFKSITGTQEDAKIDTVASNLFPKSVKKHGAKPIRNAVKLLIKTDRPPTAEQLSQMLFYLNDEELRKLAKKLAASTGVGNLQNEVVKGVAKKAA